MTFQEFALSRQLIAEERVGKAARAVQRAEDDAFGASAEALRKLEQA